MNQKRIAIINDLHPSEQAGAASIAFRVFQEMNFSIPSQYWSTVLGINKPANQLPNERRYVVSKKSAERSNLGLRGKVITEYLNVAPLIWLWKLIKVEKPSAIFVHQIGNRFPRTLLPLLYLLRIPVYTTLHDFSWIIPRKLFPGDLHIPIEDLILNSTNGTFKISGNRLNVGQSWIRVFIYKVRLHFNRIILNRFTETIAISHLQSLIYSSFGFKINHLIPNTVEKCGCSIKQAVKRQGIVLLFAGRPYGKGLHEAFRVTRENVGAVIYLAGPVELRSIAQKNLFPDQYKFLGNLTPEELFRVLHEVDFVIVLSECFDVYPTITLEAIAHGVPVITNKNTGNSHLVADINPNLVIENEQHLSLFDIQRQLEKTNGTNKITLISMKVTNDSMKRNYLDLLD